MNTTISRISGVNEIRDLGPHTIRLSGGIVVEEFAGEAICPCQEIIFEPIDESIPAQDKSNISNCPTITIACGCRKIDPK